MRRALAAAAALACVSCAAPSLQKLPGGPGMPAADAPDAFLQATAACRAVHTFTAEIAVSGSVAGRPVRGRLLAGVSAPVSSAEPLVSARLEALAPFGPPVFIMIVAGDDATLLLPRDHRVLVHGRPDAVLEAVAGVPLGGADLLAVLTGCADQEVSAAPPARVQGRQIGDWRVVNRTGDGADDVDWYLRRDASGAWRLVTAVHRRGVRPWRVEYDDFREGLPRSVRVATEDRRRFDVRLGLSQVETNVPLGPEVFTVDVPRGTEPITLEELQESGPLAESHGR